MKGGHSTIKRKDHYVPQVYLRRFLPPNDNKLYVFDRDTDTYIRPTTKTICHRPNWDKLDADGKNEYLEQHLRALEPHLNVFLDALIRREQVSDHDRFYFCNWLAIIMSLSPARIKHDTEVQQTINQQQKAVLEQAKSTIQTEQQQKVYEEIKEQLNITIDDFLCKRMAMSSIRRTAMILYASDWHLIFNETDMKFLTCDQPVHVLCWDDGVDNPYRPIGIALDPEHFLWIHPLWPHRAEQFKKANPENEKEFAAGKITYGVLSKWYKYAPKTIKNINSHTIYNADRFIISSYMTDSLKDFIRNTKKHRTTRELVSFRTKDGVTYISKPHNTFENYRPKLKDLLSNKPIDFSRF